MANMCIKKVRDEWCRHCRACDGLFLQGFVPDRGKDLGMEGTSQATARAANKTYQDTYLIEFLTVILKHKFTAVRIPEA